jgi:hypothetical protein
MLDVHVPHPTHTWKDFFIHIATIVIGLVIAIGLEQTVEAVHHHREVAETREALHQERLQNYKRLIADTAIFRLEAEQMKNNLLILTTLRQHPGTPEENLPGVLTYSAIYAPFTESAWQAARQTTVIDLMPREEVAENADLYLYFDTLHIKSEELWRVMSHAAQYGAVDPDLSHLTPAQIDLQIQRTQDCIESIYRWGVNLANIPEDHKDFPPGPTYTELTTLIGSQRSPAEHMKLAAAIQLTTDRLHSATAAADKALDDANHP